MARMPSKPVQKYGGWHDALVAADKRQDDYVALLALRGEAAAAARAQSAKGGRVRPQSAAAACTQLWGS
jgi:hypothetical protein